MSKTDENLKAAVAAESLARNRYSYFAIMAEKERIKFYPISGKNTALHWLPHLARWENDISMIVSYLLR